MEWLKNDIFFFLFYEQMMPWGRRTVHSGFGSLGLWTDRRVVLINPWLGFSAYSYMGLGPIFLNRPCVDSLSLGEKGARPVFI